MNALAISQLSTLRWDMEDDAAAYASQGFDGLGVYRRKLEDYGLDRTIELLAESSLAVTSLSWAGGFTGSDGRAVEDSIKDAIVAIREAANLRAETLIVLAGGRNNHIRSHAKRTLCEALYEVAEAADSFDVQLSLEPIHPGCGEEWSFVNDLRGGLDIVETVGHERLGLALDTYHVGMDQQTLAWIPDIMPHLRLVQFGDGRHSPVGEMNRCLLGEGCIDLRQIYDSLMQHGYRGPIEVELLGEDVEGVSYPDLVKHAKRYFDGMIGRVSQQ